MSKSRDESTNLNTEEQEFIREYVIPPQIPLTIWKLNDQLNAKFELKDRKRDIKLFLKNLLNYSYKKGGSTTIKGGSLQIKIAQSIFSAKILQLIYKDYLIINIDECSF